MVKAVAVKCRYCGFWFANPNSQPNNGQPGQQQQPGQSVQPVQPGQQQWQGNYQQQGQGNYQQQGQGNYQQQGQQGQQYYQQQGQQGQQQYYQQQGQQGQQQHYQQQGQQQYYQQQAYQQQAYQQPQQNRPFTISNSKLSIESILSEGIKLGFSKFGTIFGAIILWILTIWIPYLNVGTTIAIQAMPVSLADNENSGGPTYIFEERFRKYMGEYFTLAGLKSIALIPAYLFMIIPGIIIGLGWSQALYLLFDKHISPGEALIQSAEKTSGHKVTLFLTGLLYNLGFILIFAIFVWLTGSVIESAFLTFIVSLLLYAVYMVGSVGCFAVIYHKLCKQTEK